MRIQHDPGNEGAWICLYGNTPLQDGFVACDAASREVEPTHEAWTPAKPTSATGVGGSSTSTRLRSSATAGAVDSRGPRSPHRLAIPGPS